MPNLIEKYDPSHHAAVVEIITTIQQHEYGIPITYADQPDLANIPEFYDAFLVATISGNPVGTIGLKIIIVKHLKITQNYSVVDLSCY